MISNIGYINKKKKILIVGPELSLRGGVAHHVKTLLSSPLSKDYQLHYFRVGPNQNDNRIIIVLKFLLTPFRFLWRLWIVWPDIVHFNPSFDPKSLPREFNLLTLCKLHGRPNLIQFHGGIISDLLQNGHLPFYIKLIFRWASHLVVLTNIQKKPLLRYCPEGKISVIPNMIDTTLYYRNKQNSSSQYRILYMSKIEYKKGAYDVLEAIHFVIEKFPNVKFFFAGEGPDREKIKLLCCENGYEDVVKLLDYVQGQKKVNFLSRGDLFLFPSHYNEGMPYALLEAMAAGLPVIATRKGGIPEIIENNVNGYLIPPGQPRRLAQAILKLLSDVKLRKEFGRINRYEAETYFDIKIVCEKFSLIYEKLSSDN